MSKAVRKKYNRKMTLYIAQSGRCWLCGKKMPEPIMGAPPGTPAEDFPTLDHVVPSSKGGADSYDNYMLAHFVCNRTRGDKTEVRAIDRRAVNGGEGQ